MKWGLLKVEPVCECCPPKWSSALLGYPSQQEGAGSETPKLKFKTALRQTKHFTVIFSSAHSLYHRGQYNVYWNKWPIGETMNQLISLLVFDNSCR